MEKQKAPEQAAPVLPTLWKKAQEGNGERTGELQLGVHVGSRSGEEDEDEEDEEEEKRAKFRNKLGRACREHLMQNQNQLL
jgi:hypothetical protein